MSARLLSRPEALARVRSTAPGYAQLVRALYRAQRHPALALTRRRLWAPCRLVL